MFLLFLIYFALVSAQNKVVDQESLPDGYFITHSREEFIKKVVDMPYGVKPDDQVNVIVEKMLVFLKNYQPQTAKYPDDYFAKESNLQAAISVKEGGYGIGAILIDAGGNIIAKNHNKQVQKNRSDLHGEMSLLTDFEESRASKKYMNMYVYKPGLTVFSSAEPCPMRFIRLATAGVNTKYCTPGPEDGMASRVDFLPPDWKAMALKQKVSLGDCSPVMQKISHLLFYTFLLDDRGPK